MLSNYSKSIQAINYPRALEEQGLKLAANVIWEPFIKGPQIEFQKNKD